MVLRRVRGPSIQFFYLVVLEGCCSVYPRCGALRLHRPNNPIIAADVTPLAEDFAEGLRGSPRGVADSLYDPCTCPAKLQCAAAPLFFRGLCVGWVPKGLKAPEPHR